MILTQGEQNPVPGLGPAGFSIEDALSQAVRSFGVVLTIVRSERGVVLEGVSPTFYGKQMAQELARKANLVVAVNRIVVTGTHGR